LCQTLNSADFSLIRHDTPTIASDANLDRPSTQCCLQHLGHDAERLQQLSYAH